MRWIFKNGGSLGRNHVRYGRLALGRSVGRSVGPSVGRSVSSSQYSLTTPPNS